MFFGYENSYRRGLEKNSKRMRKKRDREKLWRNGNIVKSVDSVLRGRKVDRKQL